MKHDFTPYLPDHASALAGQVKRAWDDHPEYGQRQGRTPCKMCHSPERERVDRLVLMGTSYPKVAAALGIPNYTYGQIVRHRNEHLLPLVEKLRPTVAQMLALPWPASADRSEKLAFYTAQAFGLFCECLRSGDKRTALSALRSMAEFDLGQSGALSKALSYSRCGTDAPAAPIAMPDIVKPSPEDAAILERALRLSASRRRPWSQEPPEDTGDRPVLAATRN